MKEEVLDQAIAEWRQVSLPEETFSAEARSRILQAAFAASLDVAGSPSGFRPVLRRVVLGVIPVLAVAVVLLFSDRAGDPSKQAPVRVGAMKNGSEVVFTIANGHRSHSVYKSSVPNKFDHASALQIRDGAFRDAVEDGLGLVFYRIE